jgi:hypothetical protein
VCIVAIDILCSCPTRSRCNDLRCAPATPTCLTHPCRLCSTNNNRDAQRCARVRQAISPAARLCTRRAQTQATTRWMCPTMTLRTHRCRRHRCRRRRSVDSRFSLVMLLSNRCVLSVDVCVCVCHLSSICCFVCAWWVRVHCGQSITLQSGSPKTQRRRAAAKVSGTATSVCVCMCDVVTCRRLMLTSWRARSQRGTHRHC